MREREAKGVYVCFAEDIEYQEVFLPSLRFADAYQASRATDPR
jgi:hypothetical protein